MAAKYVSARITEAYLLLVASIFLLSFDRYGLANISAAKRFVFALLSAAYLFALLLSLLPRLRKPDFTSRRIIKHISLPQLCILLYLLFTLLSALLSDDSRIAWLGGARKEGALMIALYCVIFLCVSTFFTPTRCLLPVFAVGVTVFCVICLLQIYGANPFYLFPRMRGNEYNVYHGTFIGTIGNVDFAAAFLTLATPIFFFALLILRHKLRFGLLLPLTLTLFVLIKIRVAASFFALLIGIPFCLPFALSWKACVKRRYFAALGVSFLFTMALLFFTDSALTSLHELHELLHGRMKGSFGSGRIHIWKAVLCAVPEHFFFGTGPDTMSHAEIVTLQGKLVDAAHCEYLNILYHQGIFSCISYITAISSALRSFLRCGNTSVTATILAPAVVCYVIQAFFNISQPTTAPFFWCAFAMLSALDTK